MASCVVFASQPAPAPHSLSLPSPSLPSPPWAQARIKEYERLAALANLDAMQAERDALAADRQIAHYLGTDVATPGEAAGLNAAQKQWWQFFIPEVQCFGFRPKADKVMVRYA